MTVEGVVDGAGAGVLVVGAGAGADSGVEAVPAEDVVPDVDDVEEPLEVEVEDPLTEEAVAVPLEVSDPPPPPQPASAATASETSVHLPKVLVPTIVVS